MSLQPFALMTDELVMEIRPPVPGQTPWLPVRSLEIQENWDDTQTFKEGGVFTRSFVIRAEGIHSSQLPSLEGKLGDSSLFKIYADKPELKDETVDGILKSSRTEQYTVIPQKSGELTTPAISVGWWDTENERKRETRLPARQLQVLAAPTVATRDVVAPIVERKTEAEVIAEVPLTIHPYVYALVGSLTLLLAIMLLVLILMKKKMNRLLKVPKEKKVTTEIVPKKPPIPSKKNKWEKLDDLNPT